MRNSILPKFAVTTIDSASASTANPRLAATIYAFDVPLHESNPYTVTAGDGLKETRVVWNFNQSDRAGNSPAEICTRWHDQPWLDANPNNPLAVCKAAFEWFEQMMHMLKIRRGLDYYDGACVEITNTRKAAVLAALGHPLVGWKTRPVVTTWCLHQAAAADALLYDDAALYTKLPDAAISYARAAILGHEAMIKAIKDIQFARVEHRGRVATIGRDLGGEKLNQLEKILYRK